MLRNNEPKSLSCEPQSKQLATNYHRFDFASTEKNSCEFGSLKYYALCGFGGIVSCGITHPIMVPLDVVKCRIQTNPAKYKGIFSGFSITIKEDGIKSLSRGWAPTTIGYSLQGLGKFGFYELFKIMYSGMIGEELSYTWRTSLYLAASASAEFFSDIALQVYR